MEVWRLRAGMAQTGDQEEPTFLRLRCCVSEASHREERQDEQRAWRLPCLSREAGGEP